MLPAPAVFVYVMARSRAIKFVAGERVSTDDTLPLAALIPLTGPKLLTAMPLFVRSTAGPLIRAVSAPA